MQGTTTETYRVISAGRPLTGHTTDQVRSALAEKFKLNSARLDRLLAQPTVLKRGLDRGVAEKYIKALLAAGLDARLLKEKTTNPKAVSPTSSAKPATADAALPTRHELEALFEEPIPRLPVSIAYRTGLAAAALLCLIAPAIYFGLVAAVAYGLIRYLIAMPELLEQTHGVIGSLFTATFVPFICGIFLLFLARPLFIRYPAPRSLALDPRKYRRLYDLVNLLCARMGLPSITEIRMDNAVNASMGPSQGLRSLLQRKLTLTVGIPLIAGFSSRQLVGVIGHELGHFAQPMAMLTNHVINSVNFWMANRAYEEDPWDARLARWHELSPFFLLNIMLWLTQAMIWLTRRLFKGLFLFNLWITRHMSRQMEYDADRYECWVSGSNQFADTALRLRSLGYAAHQVHHRNIRAWDDDKLMADIPAAIVQWADTLSGQDQEAIQQGMQVRQTAVWDTHPADADRILRAETEGYTGVYQLDLPARAFLPRFSDLCRIMTVREYAGHGIEKPEQYLTANNEVLAHSQSRDQEDEALDTYFNGTLTRRFLQLKPLEADDHTLQGVVDELRQRIPHYRDTSDQFFKLIARHNAQVYGCNFLEAGISIAYDQFQLPGEDLREARIATSETAQAIQKNRKQLADVEALFGLRMRLAIATMPEPGQSRAQNLYQSLAGFQRLLDALRVANSFADPLEGILGEDDTDTRASHEKALLRASDSCKEGLAEVIRLAGSIALHTDQKNVTLRAFAAHSGVTGCMPEDNLATMQLAPITILQTQDHLNRVLDYAYYRTTAELCWLCEQTEKEQGIRPLRLVRLKTEAAEAVA